MTAPEPPGDLADMFASDANLAADRTLAYTAVHALDECFGDPIIRYGLLTAQLDTHVAPIVDGWGEREAERVREQTMNAAEWYFQCLLPPADGTWWPHVPVDHHDCGPMWTDHQIIVADVFDISGCWPSESRSRGALCAMTATVEDDERLVAVRVISRSSRSVRCIGWAPDWASSTDTPASGSGLGS